MKRLKKIIKKNDVFVVLDQKRIYYLTGFPYLEASRPFLLLIPVDGEICFIIPRMEEDHIKLFRKH